MTIALIVAIADNIVEDRGHPIGYQGTLPWKIPEDLQRFKSLTTGHPIIMGRKTHESIGRRALPKRLNIIISNTQEFTSTGLCTARSLDEALAIASNPAPTTIGFDNSIVYIIGGEQVYREALPRADKLEITHVHQTIVPADAYFPPLNDNEWKEIAREHHDTHTFATYERK